MLDKSRVNHLRRLATRAGLRLSTLRTDGGRLFAILDGQRLVATCVGYERAARELSKAAAA